METLKIGFDIHGVLDTNPKFFTMLTRALRLMKNNYGLNVEIHIITGSRYSVELENQLKAMISSSSDHVWWDKFFSVQEYCEEYHDDQAIVHDGMKQPTFPKEIWNSAKAKYCKKEKIDYHFDNQKEYFDYFETNGFVYIHKEIKEGRDEDG